MKNIPKQVYSILLSILLIMLISSCNKKATENKSHYIRVGKIVIDSIQLESYKAAIKEEMEASVRLEPGVLTLYSVHDKDNPSNVTVFEIYASVAAYQSHIQTPHFLKYKTTVKDMVKSLVLTDVTPIVLATKPK